jgi:DUF2934 family protein
MATVQKVQSGAQKYDPRDIAGQRPATAVPTDKIAARAYEIWVASGRPDGRDQEHWFQAERELTGTQSSRGAR